MLRCLQAGGRQEIVLAVHEVMLGSEHSCTTLQIIPNGSIYSRYLAQSEAVVLKFNTSGSKDLCFAGLLSHSHHWEIQCRRLADRRGGHGYLEFC